MTTKVKGTEGIEFPDATVQASAALSAFIGSNQSKTVNGYQKLPGGLIIQWGYVGIPGSGGIIVTYPIPFPNAVLACNVTPFVSSGQVANATIVSQDAGAVAFNGYIAGALSAMSIQWIAIGY